MGGGNPSIETKLAWVGIALAVISIIIGVLAILAQVLTPNIRQGLGLDPANTPTPSLLITITPPPIRTPLTPDFSSADVENAIALTLKALTTPTPSPTLFTTADVQTAIAQTLNALPSSGG